MRRIHDGVVRDNWRQLIHSQGLVFSPTEAPSGEIISYWREGPFYDFTMAEVEQLERDAVTLFEMCVDAGDFIVSRPDIMLKMGIPEFTHDQIRATWNDEPSCQSVLGRFDVRYGGDSSLDPHSDHDRIDPTMARLKLLEFNADTPTALLEAAIVQWLWFKDTAQGTDQWNAIHEALVQAWKRNLTIIEKRLGHKPVVYFTCSQAEPSGEDVMTTQYIRDTCAAAGYETKAILIEDIFWAVHDGRFYDGDGENAAHIDVLFKLYPWEHIVHDEFGKRGFLDMEHVGERSNDGRRYMGGTVWFEAPYKMIWSNKGLLPVLWNMFGDDPERSQLLLPAYFEGEQPAQMTSFVRKPLLGREGANVTIVETGTVIDRTDGIYGDEGYVLQEFAALPSFPDLDNNNHPVLGIWMIDGEPAGLGLRESRGLITDNLSHFAPHTIGYQR